MPSLSAINQRFAARFEIINGGQGQFHGVLSEPSSGEIPASQFTQARRQVRVEGRLPLQPGMVVRTSQGEVFMLADHGVSESRGGALYRAFRLFELSRQYTWETRTKRIDPATRLEVDAGLQIQGELWGLYEPKAEKSGGVLNVDFETGRFITNVSVPLNDVVDGKRVTRCDRQLGVYVLELG